MSFKYPLQIEYSYIPRKIMEILIQNWIKKFINKIYKTYG